MLPFPKAGHGTLVRIGRRMRSVKHADLPEQINPDPRSLALADFSAAGEKATTNPFADYGYAVANLRLGRHETEAAALLTQVTTEVPDVEMYARAGMTR